MSRGRIERFSLLVTIARHDRHQLHRKTRRPAYLQNVTGKLDDIEKKQADNFRKAGVMIADAVAEDRLVHVYGGGGTP